MLKQISIDGFKCFDSEEMSLNGLTLFAGRNSMGKSTVIQAILAMLQNGLLKGKELADFIKRSVELL